MKWLWAAHGKHPSVKDFFSIGRIFPISSDFAKWMKTGFPLLAEQGNKKLKGHSWRFWSRGRGKDELACGLLRDSQDSFGRPYPLLIIGSGPLPSWEDHWEMLPSVCERVWCRMELASARRFKVLGDLENEINKIRHPDPFWSDPGFIPDEIKGEAPSSRILLPTLDRFAEEAKKISESEMWKFNLGSDESNDSHSIIMQLNSIMKGNLDLAPVTFFIGGTNEVTSLILFRRPMKSSDLLTLWSMAPDIV